MLQGRPEPKNAGMRDKPPNELQLDPRVRGLLGRFLADWVRPLWREVATALVLSALLAAVTPLYPQIIKWSFDLLLGGSTDMLPVVLGAIVGVTMLRSVLLYVQTVATSRMVMRL